jgi:hypothetical protein
MPPIRRIGRPGMIGLAARTAVVAGTATAITGAAAGKQTQKAQAQLEHEQYVAAQQQAQIDAATQAAAAQYATPQPAAARVASVDVASQLQQLASLKEAGVLSDQEFADAKAKLLA